MGIDLRIYITKGTSPYFCCMGMLNFDRQRELFDLITDHKPIYEVMVA